MHTSGTESLGRAFREQRKIVHLQSGNTRSHDTNIHVIFAAVYWYDTNTFLLPDVIIYLSIDQHLTVVLN